MRFRHFLKKQHKVFFSVYISDEVIKILGVKDISLEKIPDEIEKLLTNQLPKELNKLGLDIKNVEFFDIQKGSLTLFFSLILNAYSIVSDYEGFLESIKLIRKHADRILYRYFQIPYEYIRYEYFFNKFNFDGYNYEILDTRMYVSVERIDTDFNRQNYEDGNDIGQLKQPKYSNPLIIALFLFSSIEFIFIALMGFSLFKLISLLMEQHIIK